MLLARAVAGQRVDLDRAPRVSRQRGRRGFARDGGVGLTVPVASQLGGKGLQQASDERLGTTHLAGQQSQKGDAHAHVTGFGASSDRSR